jgi:hypothetical protein
LRNQGLFDKELTPKLTGLKKTVWAIHGIQAIWVLANIVPLYLQQINYLFKLVLKFMGSV